MCFDTEKTQAPENHEVRAKLRAEREYLRRDIPMEPEGNGRLYSDAEILAELFRYHAPTPEQIPLYAAINQAAKNFAEIVLSTCPPGHDRSAAINCIRMARMTANAAIALRGVSL